jgi:hypothetical protein
MSARSGWLLALFPLAFLLVGCTAPVEYLPTPTGLALGSNSPTLIAPNFPPGPALLEQRQLVLEWPKKILAQDSDSVVLSVLLDEQGNLIATAEGPGHTTTGTPVEVPDLYATHNLVAAARLDIAGLEVDHQEIRQPLLPGRPVNFRWNIRAHEAGGYKGVVGLRLELVPKDGGPVSETLLLARPVEIQSVTVLGLPGKFARILGGLGLFVSALLGYPWFKGWLEDRRKGKLGLRRRAESTTSGKKEVNETDQ